MQSPHHFLNSTALFLFPCQDIVLDMKEWLNPNFVAKYINQCVMHVLESKSKERKQTGVVLKELIKKKLILSKDILEG